MMQRVWFWQVLVILFFAMSWYSHRAMRLASDQLRADKDTIEACAGALRAADAPLQRYAAR